MLPYFTRAYLLSKRFVSLTGVVGLIVFVVGFASSINRKTFMQFYWSFYPFLLVNHLVTFRRLKCHRRLLVTLTFFFILLICKRVNLVRERVNLVRKWVNLVRRRVNLVRRRVNLVRKWVYLVCKWVYLIRRRVSLVCKWVNLVCKRVAFVDLRTTCSNKLLVSGKFSDPLLLHFLCARKVRIC